MNECIFCEESENPSFSRTFLDKSWPYPDRILLANKTAFAIPGYGPQVFPYVLVVPRRHIFSLSETTEEERTAILNCLSALVTADIFGSSRICVFEHGGNNGSGCSCISHCHIHAISENVGLYEQLKWDRDAVSVTFNQKSTFNGGNNYLFAGIFEGAEIKGKLIRPEVSLHQYFRQMIAFINNEKQWDWRSGMNPEFMLRLMEKVKGRSNS